MNKLDVLTFKRMLMSSLNVLKENERLINDLNVFPVPDGDTGTNMRSTLESGINNIKSDDKNSFLDELALGMLEGARGNSGVILSIIFKGLTSYLKKNNEITPTIFLDALNYAKDYAYKKVKNPVEGTILSVLRLGIIIDKNFNTFEELLDMLLNKMKEVLNDTPNMLDVLKDAEVVDAGGAGLTYIISGMLNELTGNSASSFITKTEASKVRYYKQDEHKPIAYISFCIGDGIKEIFYDLGCDVIIESPNTINPSTSEIVDAINNINADNIIILPNNKNAILASEMAKELSKKKNIYILKTKNMAEGYFALSMMIRTSDNLKYQLDEMKKGIDDVLSIEVAKALKDGTYSNINYKKDEYIYLVDDKLTNTGDNLYDSLKEALDNINISQKEIMVIFTGSSVTEDEKEKLYDFITENYDLEIGILDGGFDNLKLVIGLS